MPPPRRAGRRLLRLLVYVVLVLWSVVCLLPIYWLFVTSFKPEDALTIGPYYLPFVDFQPTLSSWRFILFDSYENLRNAFYNSVTISFSATIITVLGRACARRRSA